MSNEKPSLATIARVFAQHGFPPSEPGDYVKARALEELLILLVGVFDEPVTGPVRAGAHEIAASALTLIGQALNAPDNREQTDKHGRG